MKQAAGERTPSMPGAATDKASEADVNGALKSPCREPVGARSLGLADSADEIIASGLDPQWRGVGEEHF